MLRLSTSFLRLAPMLRVPRRCIRCLSAEELVKDEDPHKHLKELGAFGLKTALTKHLASTFPDAAPGVLTDLQQANFSRYNLSWVAERLESAGRIFIFQVKEIGVEEGNGYWILHQKGIPKCIDNYIIAIAGMNNCFKVLLVIRGYLKFDFSSSLEIVARFIVCEFRLLSHFCTCYQFAKVQLEENFEDTLIRLKRDFKGHISEDKQIQLVRMRELGAVFWAGMANYAMEAAGIMYVDNKYDLQKFWENFKEYMEPIVSPEGMEDWRKEAKNFEAHMEGVIDVHPCYRIFWMKDA